MKTSFQKSIDKLAQLGGSTHKKYEVFLNLTYKCPLRCTYCYVDYDKPTALSLEQCDYLFEKLVIAPRKKFIKLVTFFGGEPALEIDTIEFILRKYYHNPNLGNTHIAIITSFSVNQERLMKLQQEFPLFEVVASYDVDNSQRLFAKKPFDALSKVDMQELEKCKHNLILHKTISGGERDLYADLMGLHKIYQEHGIIYSLNFVKTPLKFVKGDMVEEAFTKYIDMVFKDSIYDKPGAYIPKFLMHHMSRYVSREMGKMQPGCGISGELFLNGDGVFSPCSISNHQIDFPVIAEGKFLDTFEEATNLEQNYFNNPTCEPCPVKGFCAGGCLIARHMEHKDFNKPNVSHCTLITALFNAYNTVLGSLTPDEYDKLLIICGAKMAGYHQYCYDTQVHKDIYDTLNMKPAEKTNAILAS